MGKPGKSIRKTQALFFPFALFGSEGTKAGAEALADAFQEMIEDNKRETAPTRARSYAGLVRFEEFTFARLADYDDWRDEARIAVRRVLKNDDFLIWCSGNHLGVLPVYDELAQQKNTLVVQFDAHLDIYNLADCSKELSHGNYLLHCAAPPPDVICIGHRDLFLPAVHVKRHFQHAVSAADLAIDPEPTFAMLRQAGGAAERVFIDIDCDVLDPAYFPAVAHPLPFGMSPQLLLRFLDALWSPKIVGVALSEFDQARDRNDQSLSTLLWLLEYLLLRLYEGAGSAARTQK